MNIGPIRTCLAILMVVLGAGSAIIGGSVVYEASGNAIGALIGAVVIGLAGATPPWVASVVIGQLAEANEKLARIEFASRGGSPEDTIG